MWPAPDRSRLVREADDVVLRFFDTRELEEFATTLAMDLDGGFLGLASPYATPARNNRVKVIIEGLSPRAVRYHEQQQLGIYRKAELANIFKWKLKELGYTSEFAESATKELVTRLAVR